MSLTYAELQQALASLPYRHATADTNVLSVENAGTNIVKEAGEMYAKLHQ